MIDLLVCPRCGLTGDDLGNCGNTGPMCAAAAAVPMDFATMVLVKCGPCLKTQVLPVGDIVKGKRHVTARGCVHQECRARVVLPEARLPDNTRLITLEQLDALEAASEKLTEFTANGNVVLGKDALADLQARDKVLSHLEANGVDNWEGYSVPGDDDEGEADEPTAKKPGKPRAPGK